jgi:AraC-like DNA-binding protein
MTLVVDRKAIAAGHRQNGDGADFARPNVPMEVSFAPEVRLESWTLGRVRAVRVSGRDVNFERNDNERPAGFIPSAAIGLPLSGSGWLRVGERITPLTANEVSLVDLSSPYACGWSGLAWSLHVAWDQLGFSAEVVGRAAPRLTASPLYGLVANHIRGLALDIHRVAADAAASALSDATVQLLRALISSTLRDDTSSRGESADALWPLILAYVETHLTEHDLSPARIALAHHVSVRHLYKLAASHDLRLSEWIIERRLSGARDELLGSTRQTVTAIARRWGFIDPTHFSRRFRQEYGVSPRECRTRVPVAKD